MATAEELRMKEHMWQQQVLFLQNKCKSLEEKVDQRIQHAESQGGQDSSELNALKNDISATCSTVDNLKIDLTNWFKNANDEIEAGKQYSRINNGFLIGLENVPNIEGFGFICYIAQAITKLFPSLSKYGPVLPCHIDAAHPVPSKGQRSVIIVKFTNRWVKDLLLEHQHDLPHNIQFTEHITTYTHNLLASARSIVGKENAEIFRTAVFAKYNGRRHKIKNSRDIETLQRRVTENSVPPVSVSNNVSMSNTNAAQYTPHYRPSPLPPPHSHNGVVNGFRARGRPSRNGRGGRRKRGGISDLDRYHHARSQLFSNF